MIRPFLLKLLVLCVLLAAALSTLQAQSFTTFDVSGATATYAQAINPAGQVTGYFIDANGTHGFLRQIDGTVISFDGPNIGGGPVATVPVFINPTGQIVGYVATVQLTQRSFLRKPDGTFIVLPSLPTSCSSRRGMNPVQFDGDGDAATGMNAKGEIVGVYGNRCYDGFVREPDGSVTQFSIPTNVIPNTQAQAINARGQVTGYYYDADGVHGFLRESDGTLTTFRAPDADTLAYAINPAGQTAGVAGDQGFLRQPEGTILTFTVPGAASTSPKSITPAGRVAGAYLDSNFVNHGFMRDVDGTLTAFDVPGSTYTYAVGINSNGQITGWYGDATGTHGFVRQGTHRLGKH